MTALLAALALVGAGFLYQRERRLYREQQEQPETVGTDLFVYTKGRFRLRMAGVAALLGLASTLAVWELVPPLTPQALSLYLLVLTLAFAVLLGVAVADMVITARTARPDDLTRQEDRPRQKHNR